jgi:hypothetical protein
MLKIKTILFCFIFFNTIYTFSQPGFSSLSAKERLKIAEQEEAQSETDAAYQTMMKDGHELFQQGMYLKAVHKYEEARDKRPFNVYPKIIITDIELSMKDTLKILRAQEEKLKSEEKLKNTSQAEIKNSNPNYDSNHAIEQKKLDDWEKSERERLEKQREQKIQKPESTEIQKSGADVPKMSIDDFRKELGVKYPNGFTEEVYTEGNKTITKRIIVVNSKGDEYKKVVSNNWGGVFYFKNGVSITERIWTEETKH